MCLLRSSGLSMSSDNGSRPSRAWKYPKPCGATPFATIPFASRSRWSFRMPKMIRVLRITHSSLVIPIFGSMEVSRYARPMDTTSARCARSTYVREFRDDNEIEILSDLASIAMDHLELQHLAMTDGLTGALSRRAFRNEAAVAVAFAQRRAHSLSCISIDIDHFKSVNDMHGHGVGDVVLRRSLANCRLELRTSDIIGRIGGEEFAIILPDTAEDAALGLAVKLRKAIKSEVFESTKGSFAVSASMGVASLDETTHDLDSLLREADIALFKAKKSGRDRCVQAIPRSEDSEALRERIWKADYLAKRLRPP